MGATGLHTADQITAFLGDGETRLIAAAHRDPDRRGELFVLPDNQATELRAFAKQHLRCMFDDCTVPDLTTVSRPKGRDGFRHGRGGGKHAPESVNHRQGKAVVAEWLRATYPTATVIVEQATDTQRSNVADVMLTLDSGQRVAFEVQYAALSVADWRRRHESYLQQGIIDVWLWGHTRVRKSRREPGIYRLEGVQDELREAGMRVTFLNPETEQIGIAAGSWDGRACLATEREYELVVEDLSRVRVSPDGLTSHVIGPLAAVSNERRKAMDAELADQARRAREAEALKAEREARAALEEAQRRAEREARLDHDLAHMGRNRSWFDDGEYVVRKQRLQKPARPLDPDYAAANGLCRNCGLPLDPIITNGVHFGPCEERDARHRRPAGLF